MKGMALTTLEEILMDNLTTETRLDLQIQVTRDNNKVITRGIVMLDNSIDQDASLLLQLNQGDLKEDPLLGPNLLKYIRSNATKSEILRAIKLQFNRAGFNFDDFKDRMTMILNKSTNEEDITVN